VEPAALWQAIRQGATGRTRTFDNLGRSILPGPADPPNFQLRLAFKDAQLAVQVGRDAGVPMALCDLTVLSMMEAMNRGWGARDSSAVHLLQQERAGLAPFAVPKEEISRILASDET
jgi:3-hydroxyisobutyrate dehydrogenase